METSRRTSGAVLQVFAVLLGGLALPLAGAAPHWLLGRESVAAQFLSPVALVLASFPVLLLLTRTMPVTRRRESLHGIAMGLRLIAPILAILGLLSGIAGVLAWQDGLDADPAAGFGAALAGALLFAGMHRLYARTHAGCETG
jgi:hypothetical protein